MFQVFNQSQSMDQNAFKDLCNIDDEDERLRISTSPSYLYQRYTLIMIVDLILMICVLFVQNKT